MDLLRIYARVLALLGPEARLGWLLALGNLALAASQFAEPVLFGRIIDALAGAERAGGQAPAETIVVTPPCKDESIQPSWFCRGVQSPATGWT